MPSLKNCPDCGAEPGNKHKPGCDVERCSSCGCQRFSCSCRSSDSSFSRWTGVWPGELEAAYLEIDLNEFYSKDYYKIFFVKPK